MTDLRRPELSGSGLNHTVSFTPNPNAVPTTATEEEIEVEDVYTDDEEEEEPSVSSGSERGSGINSLESETVLKGKFFLYYHSDTEKFV